MAKSNKYHGHRKITFMDYTFDLLPNGDIVFDEKLNMEQLRFYEDKTFKVKWEDDKIRLKFVEDWDMLPDPDDINWKKYHEN